MKSNIKFQVIFLLFLASVVSWADADPVTLYNNTFQYGKSLEFFWETINLLSEVKINIYFKIFEAVVNIGFSFLENYLENILRYTRYT